MKSTHKKLIHGMESLGSVVIPYDQGSVSKERISAFFAAVPEILEVSIGHAFTAEALWLGIEETTKQYLDITQQVNRI